MNRLINLILASRWISPSDQGGVAMHNGYLIEALRGHVDLKIISLKNSVNETFYAKQNIPCHGLELKSLELLYRLALTPFLKNGIRSWQDYKISKAMAKALKALNPDVIEFMDIHSEAYVYLKNSSKSGRKTKVVIRAHTPWSLLKKTYPPDDIKGVDGWWAIQREHFCFHQCDAITTPSEDLKKQLIEIYNLPETKITVSPNLLDTSHFKPLPQNKDTKVFTFLHVGRFERAKGVITLTKAFIKLANEYPNVKLINIGQPRGNAYTICIDLLKQEGLIDKVEFAGFIPYDELPNWYAQSDAVVVTPEIYESFSYTVAQAMACGKFVIASDSGGMPETVGYGKYGRIFKKGNVDDLYLAMKEAINNPTLETKAAVQYAQERFSLAALGHQFLDFYKKLCN